VLSGFLITRLLLEEAEKPRFQALGDFDARRARRLLPAAMVTDVVVYRLLNFVRAKQVTHDSIFASLFTANIHFASRAKRHWQKVVVLNDPPGQARQPVDCLLGTGATMGSVRILPRKPRRRSRTSSPTWRKPRALAFSTRGIGSALTACVRWSSAV
jgi:hypothetical protein